MVKNREKENIFLKMEKYILVNGKKEKEMVKENIFGITKINFMVIININKGNGSTIIEMDMVQKYGKTMINLKEIG